MSDTKSKIITAAIQTLSNRPTASMEEIAESIGLNRRTLHRYFEGKSDLIDAITAHACSVCLANTIASMDSSNDPTDQLKAMFFSDIKSGYQFRFLYHYHVDTNKIENESSHFNEMMKIFRNLLKTLYSSGQISQNLTLEWIECHYFSTIDAAINLMLKADSDEHKILEMAWKTYFKGITDQ